MPLGHRSTLFFLQRFPSFSPSTSTLTSVSLSTSSFRLCCRSLATLAPLTKTTLSANLPPPSPPPSPSPSPAPASAFCASSDTSFHPPDLALVRFPLTFAMTVKKDHQAAVAEAVAQAHRDHVFPPKLQGWDFYRTVLKSPKYIVAPMVDQSELAWRVLSRKYNADLCYTPMFNAKLFAKEQKYRDEHWEGLKDGLGGGGPNDRPLIAQFCANDPEYLLQAALMVAPYCDAVDINLGCPQHIARRGHYGSFLMEDWPLISSLISTLHKNLPIPVTAKIRVFPEAEKTVEYAKMVVASGAQVLVVHGRLREMKGHKTGVADWEKIRLVQEAVGHLVPVVANGNILYHNDIAACIEKTGCAGVMSAEGNLYNPAIFTPEHPESWRLAEEYLTICDELDTKIAYTRGHLFKIFRPSLTVHTDLRTELGLANSRERMWEVTKLLKERLIADAEASKLAGEDFEGKVDENGFPILPHWFAQPYFRQPMPEDTANKDEGGDALKLERLESNTSTKRTAAESAHREGEDDNTTVAGSQDVTKPTKVKKQKVKKIKDTANLCSGTGCNNAISPKCAFHRCKGCCRGHQREIDRYSCDAHPIRSMISSTNNNNTSNLPRVSSVEAIGNVVLEGMVVNELHPASPSVEQGEFQFSAGTGTDSKSQCNIL